jgi:lysophospholipase L1-like esterase
MGHHLVPSRWNATCRLLATALLAVFVGVATPAAASASRLYVGFGDSVGAGFGATAGHSFFDLYCAYLESSSIVDHCINEAVGGTTSQSALTGGMVHNVINDIESSTDTPVVTVSLGGNDLFTPGCQPITAPSCPFIHNMRTILDQLEPALATRPGPHRIQWLEYYNPNHDNPFGNASLDQSAAEQLLGNDLSYTDCASHELSLIGLNDVINCIAREKGATPVDAYVPFQTNCVNNDCFSDQLHPDDKGYGLIFDAFRDTGGSPVPSTPAPDGSWPYAASSRPTISGLFETRQRFAPGSARHVSGTVFSFDLDQPAKVRIAIERTAPGRLVGRACRLPTRGLRHKRPCTRTIPISTIVRQEPPGLDRLAFSGRVHGEALKPGRYVATFVALDSAGASSPQSLLFTVTRG